VPPPPEPRPAAATTEADAKEVEGGVEVDQGVEQQIEVLEAAQSRVSMRDELQRISHQQASASVSSKRKEDKGKPTVCGASPPPSFLSLARSSRLAR